VNQPPPGGERDLRPLFAPRSVAVVGASADASKWGGDIAARLVRTSGERPLYLVNRRGGDLHGRPAYVSLRDLPEAPELVVLAMPAASLDAVLDDALGLGTKAFIGLFAGLGEVGAEGRSREHAAAARVRAAGAMLLGPNCMGLADRASGFEAVAYLDIPPGDVAFVSQSGAMGEEFVMRARAWGCGFSRYVTLGNQADVGAVEIVESLAAHAETRVVAVYLEGLGDGRRLAAAAGALVAGGRPVVLLAPGRSAAGARAALSHTGALAPDAAVVDAVCDAAGIVRAETPRELFELTMALRMRERPHGRRTAVVSDGGGPGGVAADALVAAGSTVPALGLATTAALRRVLPGSAGANPVDLALGTIDPDGFARAVPVVAADPDVDAVVAVGQLGYWSGRFPEQAELVAAEVAGAGALAAAVRRTGTPLVVATVYDDAMPARELRASGIPVYREIASAVAAVSALAAVTEGSAPRVPGVPPPGAPLSGGVDYWAAREALAGAGLAFMPGRRARDAGEAAAAARELGFPVAVKALGLLHKSDTGGVVLGLPDADAVAAAVTAMAVRLDPPGFVVERMAPAGGVELIAGCRWTAACGPLALVGAGGVYAELLADTCAALAPLDEAAAARMIARLRAAALLSGARGRPPLDAAAAAAAAAGLSRFAAAHPEVLEVEVNPLLVLPHGAVALDARIIIGSCHGSPKAYEEVEP
jgi:acyl-CoA synthetase (NDP forming)